MDGDLAAAIALYWWNVGVSAAFYTPLHCLEVALRNAIHRQLSHHIGRTDWWESVPLRGNEQRIVAGARSKVNARRRTHAADDIVAELSLGFWVSLTSGTYHRLLWVPIPRKAFPCYRGPLRALHDDLHTMLLFRNRIMHH
ncbi:hypothetical protein [Amycolatopsis pigmentata]|uniref:Abi-like protein n=1 Tax=Amycolatopsis pigmentata TaxID=450801 RepID=A0ABW5G763_9PSEU